MLKKLTNKLAQNTLSPLSLLSPSETISFSKFSLTSTRTESKLLESRSQLEELLVWDTQLNLGVLVGLLLVFPELVVLVLIDLVKLLLVINAERVECSLP